MFMFLMIVLPKNLLSYLTGKIVNWRLPQPLGRWSVRWFARRYHINVNEAELPLEDYPSIGPFFTRRLRSGIRPMLADNVHPVDAVLSRVQSVERDVVVQAKGKDYRLTDLLQLSSEKIPIGGTALTYYLCPTDYHRVHSPFKAEIVSCKHIPGQLWPVNIWSVRHIENLFPRNERVVIELQCGDFTSYLVMVGATNVGRMTMSFDADVVTNQPTAVIKNRTKHYAKPISVNAGEELGVFNMGSTVILILPPQFQLAESVIPETKTKLGQPLGQWR